MSGLGIQWFDMVGLGNTLVNAELLFWYLSTLDSTVHKETPLAAAMVVFESFLIY